MKNALFLACALLLTVASLAAANEGGGTYQRQRMHGGRHFNYHGGHPGWGGFYYQPQVYGSWYERPYPHHFDYFRWRYSAPPATLPVEYPCVEVPKLEHKP